MQNFKLLKPEGNPIIHNAGYGFAACSILGFLLFAILPASTTSFDSGPHPAAIIIPLLLFIFGGIGPFLRYWICARNPEDAEPLPQHEMDDINQKMEGQWQIEFSQNPLLQCLGGTVEEVEVSNGNYTRYVYRRHHGSTKVINKLQFFRSSDGRLWFDNYGQQVYELDLPNRFVIVNHMGVDLTWKRRSGEAQMNNQTPVYTDSRPPAYNTNPPDYNPSAPPTYDSGTSGTVAPSNQNSGGKSIGEQLRELNELKEQGILSQSEFETAKTKVLA